MTSNQHYIDRLQEAQDLLREALDILKDVARETDSPQAEAYIIPGLATLIDHESEWLNRYDHTVQDWIDELRGEDNEDTEDDGDLEPESITTPAPLVDQPSFPHDAADDQFEGVRENYRANPYASFIQRYGTAYAHDYNVSQELGEAAIRYILGEQS